LLPRFCRYLILIGAHMAAGDGGHLPTWNQIAAGLIMSLGLFDVTDFRRQGMINWGLVFFIVAIMAAAFGLGGIAASSAGVVQLLASMLTAFFAISLLAGFYRRAR
jgi:uncharacterized membrane protein YtjA (UPF0391 family)